MIRVLVVDDSPTMRAILCALLRREPDIEVVGTASDAAEAREAIRRTDPDVVTLDLNMPGMNGLDFLERLMRLRPTPVIVVSAFTREGAEATVRALELGAVDCVAKPEGRMGELLSNGSDRLAQLVRLASEARPRALERPAKVQATSEAAPSTPRLIAVGASTGGIEALHVLLSTFPEDCPPTLIVQHIDGHFAEAVARRLDERCAPRVQLAEADMPVRSGQVLLAPGNSRHLVVSGTAAPTTRLRALDPVSGHRPSVDVLFRSVAETVGRDAVGILLTGMGSDGAEGLLALSKADALTIAQDEATCTVFGMPRAAIRLGAAKVVAPVHRIASHVLRKAA